MLQNTPLHPVLGWERVRFGGPEVASERRLAELRSLLADVKLDPRKLAPLLAPWSAFLPRLSACRSFHRRRFAAVSWTPWSSGRSPRPATRPLVLVFEGFAVVRPNVDRSRAGDERQRRAGANSYFGDSATRIPAAVGSAAASSRDLAVAARRGAAAPLIAELAPRRTLSTDVMRRVSERAGGVPLFIEEVTQLVLDRGERSSAQAIPPTNASRWLRGLTDWDQRARSRRSAQCSGGASPTRCCATSRERLRLPIRGSTKPRFNPP